jgi:transposase
VTGLERRQVTEIPPVKAEVTEHQMIERECPGCGARTKGPAPDGVNAPVQYGPRAAAMATYLWHGQFLSRDRVLPVTEDSDGGGAGDSDVGVLQGPAAVVAAGPWW